jgi:hypothetical protein
MNPVLPENAVKTAVHSLSCNTGYPPWPVLRAFCAALFSEFSCDQLTCTDGSVTGMREACKTFFITGNS